MKAKPQPSLYSPKMTAVERKFAERCQIQKLAGELADWAYELIILRTSAGNYTPDFMLTGNTDEVYMVEIKAKRGNWRSGSRDAMPRFKAAKNRFWQFEFIWMDYEGGNFTARDIN